MMICLIAKRVRDPDLPTTIEEASESDYSFEWKKATDSEHDSLI